MKQVLLFAVFVILASTAGYSQTKKIFHASHSGSARSFSIASGGLNNFGLGHDKEVVRKKDTTKVKKDTVGKVPDTSSRKQPLTPPKKAPVTRKKK